MSGDARTAQVRYRRRRPTVGCGGSRTIKLESSRRVNAAANARRYGVSQPPTSPCLPSLHCTTGKATRTTSGAANASVMLCARATSPICPDAVYRSEQEPALEPVFASARRLCATKQKRRPQRGAGAEGCVPASVSNAGTPPQTRALASRGNAASSPAPCRAAAARCQPARASVCSPPTVGRVRHRPSRG